MAFGFFKKKDFADIIFKDGHVYTQDPEFPWASAVACKEGKVLAVGDFEGMDEITGEETAIIDLNGRYMFPGFIDVHGTPVLKAFEDLYMQIDPIWDLDTVLEMVEEYADSCEEEIIFGVGFDEKILADYDEPEDACKLLDEIANDRPVILLSASGYHCWLNTLADGIVTEAADDAELEFITAAFALHVLAPFDFEQVEECVHGVLEDLTDKGITSFLDLCAPEYFSGLFRDCMLGMLGESETLTQRYFGSLYVNRPLAPKLVSHKISEADTTCMELCGLINFDMLKLEVSSDEDLAYFPEDALKEICIGTADKGYAIHIDALDDEAAELAAATFDLLRAKGYKKNTFVMATDSKLDKPEDFEGEEDFITTWPTDYLNQSVFSHSSSVSEAVDNLTIRAAKILGKEKEFGSIEQGKNADFTVFEENPFDRDLKYFSGMHADMTVIDSMVVYDVEEENAREMYKMMTGMQV